MASPARAQTTNSAETSATTSHTVSLPGSLTNGNLLIAFFEADFTGGSTTTITWPTGDGWVELFEDDWVNTLGIAYKEIDGTEGATITVTTNNSIRSRHICWEVSGNADPDTQAPEVSGAPETANTSTPNPPSMTPSGGSKDFLWIAVTGRDNNTGRTVSAYPSGYSGGEENQSTDVGVSVAYLQSTASSENPGSFTLSGAEDCVTTTVAVHPGAAAPETFQKQLADLSGLTDQISASVTQQSLRTKWTALIRETVAQQ